MERLDDANATAAVTTAWTLSFDQSGRFARRVMERAEQIAAGSFVN